MRHAVIAIDPMVVNKKAFKNFLEIVSQLKENQQFEKMTLLSVMHGSQFAVPYSWYQKSKNDLELEVYEKVARAVGNKLGDSPLIVLESSSVHPEDVAHVLNDYALDVGADVLVVMNKERSLLARMILGSVTKALQRFKQTPVVVIQSRRQRIRSPPEGIQSKSSSSKDFLRLKGFW